MAIVLVEEVLMGLDEAKDSLEQAVITLEELIDDIHPEVTPNLDGVLAESLLRPLQSQIGMLEILLEELAA
jgi:hypothetical protein